MNREQAENILDAYVESARSKSVNGRKAAGSLREVIINAMTETRYYPLMTQPIRPTMPTVEPYKPTITWTSEGETGQMEVNA